MSKIMLALDGSALAEQALPYALSQLRSPADELVLVRVSEPSPVMVVPEMAGPMALDLRPDADAYLARVSAPLRERGLKVGCLSLVGLARQELVEAAHAQEVDLLVLSSHGRTGWQRWLIGSVAENVARRAPCPTLIVRCLETAPCEEPNFRNILVPLDTSPLAEKALDFVVEHFRGQPVKLWLLSATSMPAGAGYVYDSRDVRQGMIAALESHLQGHASVLREQGWDVETLVVDDSAAAAIVDTAAQHECDLIAMGSRGTTGLERWMMGSVAERVMRHATCPTLLVSRRVRVEREPGRVVEAPAQA